MTDQKTISLQVTDIMQEMMNGFPSDVSPIFFEVYFSAMLEMACMMLQFGDLDVDAGDNGALHVIAHTAQGVRNLTINVEFNK